METPTDCLVLRIFDKDSLKDNKTANLFILYDVKTREYVIRGSNDHVYRFVPFSFTCRYRDDLIDFIEIFLCKQCNWSYELYNYDNLPAESNDITYEFLHDNLDDSYNIVSYDDEKYSKRSLKKWLRILQYVKNDYDMNDSAFF
jgi:hypothetical protein